MPYRADINIGLKRALRSPGPLSAWNRNIGIARAGAAIAKALNVALTPFRPRGIKLELLQRSIIDPPKSDPIRLQVARDVFSALSNKKAAELAKRATIENYTTAIRSHHPAGRLLNYHHILSNCRALVDTIYSRLADIASKPEFLQEEMTAMCRTARAPEHFWFSEYDEAYKQYKQTDKLPQRDRMLFPFIVGESLVDIGCGGGDQVANFKREHPELKNAAGIDILDWKTPGLDIDYHVIDFLKPGSASPEKYETGLLLAVLHHVGADVAEIMTFMKGVSTAVSKRLIVEEDVLMGEDDLALKVPGVDEIAKLRAVQPFLDEYLRLDISTQQAFATLIDFLGNSLSVSVPQMAFPFGFRTMTEWKRIFEASGFYLNRVKVLGFQPGNFNQQCHVLFVLDKMAL